MPVVCPALLIALISLVIATALTVTYAVNHLIHPVRSLVGGIPSDYGLPYERVSFQSLDGTTLRGWFIRAINPRGTVVFCHGYAGNKAPDLQYVPQFREHGYNVLLFDLRAHGESDGDRTSLIYYERGDLLAAIAYLQQQGINQVGLMGFSLGAAVAMATAPLSEAVRAVIADSGFAELRTIVSNYVQTKGVPRLIASPLTMLIIWAAGYHLGCYLPDSDPLHWVNHLAPRPLLIIHGGQDRDVPVGEAYRLYKVASEPKELWIVPEADHRHVDQICPDEYMSRVCAFFDKWL